MRTQDDLINTIAEWIKGPEENVLLAMDAPLGWPRNLGRQLAEHQAGELLPGESNQLFRRHTDREIKRRLGKQPLDVGADRIARTAHAALGLLEALRQRTGLAIPLAWNADRIVHRSSGGHELRDPLAGIKCTAEPAVSSSPVVEPAACHGVGLRRRGPRRTGSVGPRSSAWAIEVYPAGTLKTHGIDATGYKKKSGREKRAEIIEQISALIEVPKQLVPVLAETDDTLDAALCLLAGADFLSGKATGPGDDELELARKEGWIWL